MFEELKDALNMHFCVSLPKEAVAVARYHSFRPTGNTKSVKAFPGRNDDVLLDTTEVPPWARLAGFYVVTIDDVNYTLARVRVFK